MSQMQSVLFLIKVTSSTLKPNDLIWAKNAKSWIPSFSSWGPINVAHLKNFGILDRHALQFLNVYSSVHPSIFKSYIFQVLQKFKWIWNFYYWADLAVMALLEKTSILPKYSTFEGVSLILLWAKKIKSYIFCIF